MCPRHKSPASPSWSPRAGLGNHDDVTLTWSGQRRCDIVVVPWAAGKGISPGPPVRTGALSHCAGPNRARCHIVPVAAGHHGVSAALYGTRVVGESRARAGREPGGRTAL